MPGISEPFQTGGRQRYILEDFTAGLHSEENISKVQIADTECTCASNIEFWPVGTISKRYGRSYKCSNLGLSGSILGMYQWWSNAGANYLMVFTALSGTGATEISGAVYSVTPATVSTMTNITSGGTKVWNPPEGTNISVETFGGSAFFCNGTDHLLAWDGTTCSAVTTAPTGAVCVKSYKNYLFVANIVDSDGRHYSRIRWSDPGDGHTWPSPNYMDLDGDDGDYISGMEVLGNELIVFKERKILAVTYVGGQYDFYAEGRQSGVGCAAGGSIIPIFSELLFYGIENFYSFNGRDVESLGDKIKDIITGTILPSNRANIKGVMYEEKDQVWWAVPLEASTSSGNTHILVLDYIRDGWTIFSGEVASFCWYTETTDKQFADLDEDYSAYGYAWNTRLFLSNSSTILGGTYTTTTAKSYILELGTGGSLSDLSQDYTGFWRSRWLDFGMPDINKRIIRMTVYIDKEVASESLDYDLYLKIYKDYDMSTVASTQAISVYGSYPVLERRVDFSMTCRTCLLEIGSTKKDQPFTIHKIVIEYIPKGRTLVT